MLLPPPELSGGACALSGLSAATCGKTGRRRGWGRGGGRGTEEEGGIRFWDMIRYEMEGVGPHPTRLVNMEANVDSQLVAVIDGKWT